MPGTKQVRLNEPVQIREKINAFVGSKINVVLKDNCVIIGELKKAGTTGIDLLNMRLKKMKYSYAEISEIYFDVIV